METKQGHRSSVVLAELSDDEAVSMYDSHLERAEGCLDPLLQQVSSGTVRCKKLAIEFFSHLTQVRNALLRLAPGERSSLVAAFGSTEEGCERVARLLVLLNGGAEANAEPEGGIMHLQHSGGDVEAVVGTAERLDITNDALRAYRSVAGVLDAVSLGEAIKRAQERRRENHKLFLGVASKLRMRSSMARRSVAQDSYNEQEATPAEKAASLPAQENTECVAATVQEDQAPHTTDRLLAMLDDTLSTNCSEYLDQIFAKLDANGDGVLTGQEYDSLMDSVTAYVVREYEQKFSRLNMKCDKTMIAGWVRSSLDQDGDRQITRAELALLKKVVDDID